MNKRIICLVLTAALMLGVLLLNAPTAHAEKEESVRYTLSQKAIDILKKDEGFESKPYWDYHHYSIGYGTMCPDDKVSYYKKNPITKEEGEKMLKEHAAKFEKAIYKFADKYGLKLTQYQLDALVLFSYNVGSAWTTETDGIFHNVIKKGATGNDVINAFVLWSKTDDKYTSGKLRRRRCDANMYLNGVYSRTSPKNFCYTLFNLNGGKSKSYLVQGYDSNITAVPSPVATYEGYIFEGWYTAASGGEKVTILDADTNGATLYAHWRADDGKEAPEQKPTGVKVTVTKEGAQHYAGPGAAYKTKDGTVPSGKKIVIEETALVGDTMWGRYGDCWFDLSYTDYESVMEALRNRVLYTAKVKVGTKLNIRSGPSTGYDVVGSLKNGAKVEVKEEKKAGSTVWARIDKGWISTDYLKDIKYVVYDEPEDEEQEETTAPTEPAETTKPTEPAETTKPTEPAETTKPTEPEETTEPTEPQKPAEPEKPKTITGVVKVNDKLRIRKGPGTSYAVAGYLKKNAKVTITETKTVKGTVWGKISKGWVSMDYITVTDTDSTTTTQKPSTETTTGKTYKVTASKLNVRKAAGTGNKIVSYYKKGAKVTVLETKKVGSTTWGRTSKGWISMKYVK